MLTEIKKAYERLLRLRTTGYMMLRMHIAPRPVDLPIHDDHELIATVSAHEQSEIVLFDEHEEVLAVVKLMYSKNTSNLVTVGVKAKPNVSVKRGVNVAGLTDKYLKFSEENTRSRVLNDSRT